MGTTTVWKISPQRRKRHQLFDDVAHVLFGFANRFLNVLVGGLIGDSITYADSVSFGEEPGVDDRLYVGVEAGGDFVAQLECDHVHQVTRRSTDRLRADDARQQLAVFD